MPSCTRIRLEHTHVWPAFLNLEVMAPATAASKSASSNTMKGALPPSSSDRRFTVSARSEEHTSELQSLMRISYAVFCLKKKTNQMNIRPLASIIIDNTDQNTSKYQL